MGKYYSYNEATKKWVCNLCQREFPNKGILLAHLRTEHADVLGKTVEFAGVAEERGAVDYKLIGRKGINLEGSDLYVAELLIRQGVAKNLDELVKKALRTFAVFTLFPLYPIAGGNMADEELKRLVEKLVEKGKGLNLENALAYKVIKDEEKNKSMDWLPLFQMNQMMMQMMLQQRQNSDPLVPLLMSQMNTMMAMLASRKGDDEKLINMLNQQFQALKDMLTQREKVSDWVAALKELGESREKVTDIIKALEAAKKEKEIEVEKLRKELEEMRQKDIVSRQHALYEELKKLKDKLEDLTKGDIDAKIKEKVRDLIASKIDKALSSVKKEETTATDRIFDVLAGISQSLPDILKALKETRQEKLLREILQRQPPVMEVPQEVQPPQAQPQEVQVEAQSQEAEKPKARVEIPE